MCPDSLLYRTEWNWVKVGSLIAHIPDMNFSQMTFTCSKSKMKAPEQHVKYVQRQPFPGTNYLPCSTSRQANLSCVLLISEIFMTFLANAPFQYIMETSLNKGHQTLPENRSGRLLLYDEVRIHASIIINLTMGDSEVSLNMHLSEDWPHIHSFFL